VSRLTSITALARTIDPRLRTHQFHLAVAVLGGLMVLAVEVERLGSLARAINPAANAGVTIFLAWAIAREIDPDDAHTANLAAVLAVAGRLVTGPGALPALIMVLLAARIAGRSTGLPPTLLDGFVFLPAASFYAGRTITGWVTALVLAFALARDRRLPDPAGARTLVAAFLVSAAASGSVILSGSFASGWQVPEPFSLALMAAGALAGLTLPGYLPTSRTDYTGGILDYFRLRSARRIILGGALLTAVLAGAPGVAGLSAVWVVLVAATLNARKLAPPFGPA
jgi:hypothetical protein